MCISFVFYICTVDFLELYLGEYGMRWLASAVKKDSNCVLGRKLGDGYSIDVHLNLT